MSAARSRSGRRAAWIGGGLLAAALISWSCAAQRQAPAMTDLALSAAERRELVRSVRAKLQGEEVPYAIPERLRDSREQRRVFLTLGDGRTRGRTFAATGRGLKAAFDDAVGAAGNADANWVLLEIESSRAPITWPITEIRSVAGLLGLVFGDDEAYAVPGQVVVAGLIDRNGMPSEGRLRRWLERGGKDVRLPTARFTTEAAFADATGARVLYRDHAELDSLTAADTLEFARSGGRYLARAVRPEGRFAYKYWPKADLVREGYNVLRHAGTVYAMFELLDRYEDAEVGAAATRALAGLLQFVVRCPPPAEAERCVAEGGAVKLGGNALAILAMTEHMRVSGDVQYVPLMRSLGRYLLALQQPDGRFWPHKQSLPDGAASTHVSIYYPGEAVLALMRLHEIEPQGPWLAAAERAARYLIEIRDVTLPDEELPHDHWLLYGINELYRARPDPLFLAHAMRIARTIVESQNRDPLYPDWLGSFYEPPRSTPASTRIEGLIAAYAMARDFGDAGDAESFREAIELGVRYFLRHQFRPESTIHLPNPPRAIGGFRRSFASYEIRIDYVQHAISALLGYEALLAASS